MNKIRITYFGDAAPDIKCDNLADLERIELIDGEEARWLFLKRGELSVYRTMSCRAQDIFVDDTFSMIRGVEEDASDTFHLDDLPEIPEAEVTLYTCDYPDDDTKQKLAYAIDAGHLTEEGLLDRCRDCGVPVGMAGDGSDGRCGNCVDARENKARAAGKEAGEEDCRACKESPQTFVATPNPYKQASAYYLHELWREAYETAYEGGL